ncbi:MAG TPA: hypothetical protein VFJ58_05445 [Armatimonadota bacterium]|nr:hypothetical protein [Armatimonadota bacterium]
MRYNQAGRVLAVIVAASLAAHGASGAISDTEAANRLFLTRLAP